ncbi:hypothetical protein [Curtobacterium ammoniigenes]|nr:hypothetical protein [Curtobacterium ammoniigenes]
MIGSDGITDAHRTTWNRLTRLHLATTSIPDRTTFRDDAERCDARR